MGRLHAEELEAIPSTIAWSNSLDIIGWKASLTCATGKEAVIVASGGSYSAALLLAQLHMRHTGKLAIALTPLEFMAMEPIPGAAIWLISVGGSNRDILAAYDTAISRQFAALFVLCGDTCSPLVARAKGVEKAEVFAFNHVAGRDGFLATNSLIALYSLLLRLYDEQTVTEAGQIEVSSKERALFDRETLIVLYDGWLKAVAVDLESRFSEAALGNVQICDYRNFAHGRHHWLAKRGRSSSVLALVTPTSRKLAMQTLAELPVEVARDSWTFESDGPLISLQGLLRSISFAAVAARRLGIDPGRPGVPDFGRRIYEMGPVRSLPSRDHVLRGLAIERKAGSSMAALRRNGQAQVWERALESFVTSLSNVVLGGVVFDFDGTMVATRRRFDPVSELVSDEVVRLLGQGIRIGIATGRGKSVWKELRSTTPPQYWDQVVVGYYNASVLRFLSEDVSDIATGDPGPALVPCLAALAADGDLRERAIVEYRPTQITVSGHSCDEDELWSLVSHALDRARLDGVKVVRSSHSVDVIERNCSKCAVVASLKQGIARSAHILKIGDRGRWPGNDSELLEMELALSVDETSRAHGTGWNLLPPGLSGAAGTARYLACIESGRFYPTRLMA